MEAKTLEYTAGMSENRWKSGDPKRSLDENRDIAMSSDDLEEEKAPNCRLGYL
jgi:hypothetical protein